MRDLLELIVGEWKEHDEEPEPSDIEKIGDSLWRIQGAASLDEVAEELDVELPLDEYDTFGGYVLNFVMCQMMAHKFLFLHLILKLWLLQ